MTEIVENQGCSAKKESGGTALPYQIKGKNARNSFVSIRLQNFPYWIFQFHCRIVTSSVNLRGASTSVR